MSNRDIGKLYSESVSKRKFDTISSRFVNEARVTISFDDKNVDDITLDNISDADAAVLYNSGTPGDATEMDDLVAYWKFNEASGTSVEDSSSNSNTATLVNGTAFEQIRIS